MEPNHFIIFILMVFFFFWPSSLLYVFFFNFKFFITQFQKTYCKQNFAGWGPKSEVTPLIHFKCGRWCVVGCFKGRATVPL